MLMEEEAKKADSSLAETVTKLALASKDADGILKKVKYFESKTMNSEVEIEEADKNLRETTKMASDNEQKLDELTRKLGVQEDELKRSTERAELAEGTYLKCFKSLILSFSLHDCPILRCILDKMGKHLQIYKIHLVGN